MTPQHPDEQLSLVDLGINALLCAAMAWRLMFPAVQFQSQAEVRRDLPVDLLSDVPCDVALLAEVSGRGEKHGDDFESGHSALNLVGRRSGDVCRDWQRSRR